MTEKNQIYRCEICGNIIEVLHEGADALVCCGQPMNLLKAKDKDQGQEKHVPVVEKTDKGIKVKVGSIEHPMIEEHYIEWIEVISNNKVYRRFLKAGEKPEAEFCVNKVDLVREYCNVHGLWTNQ